MSKHGARIADFMAKLSVDPKLRSRFQDEPSMVAGEAGLTDEELSLLAGGSSARINQELGGEAMANCFVLFASDGDTAS